MSKIATLTPTLSNYYRNTPYSQKETDELVSLLLSDDEKRRYDKMKWDTPKQSFLALATMIDLSIFKNAK